MNNMSKTTTESLLMFVSCLRVPVIWAQIAGDPYSPGLPVDESSFDGDLHFVPVEELEQITELEFASGVFIKDDVVLSVVAIEPATAWVDPLGLARFLKSPLGLAGTSNPPEDVDFRLPVSLSLVEAVQLGDSVVVPNKFLGVYVSNFL